MTGSDALLFRGTFGVIRSPVPYDKVRTDRSSLKVQDNVRDGLGVLVFAGTAGFSPDAQADGAGTVAPETATVEFLQGPDTVVHRCTVSLVDFDPKVHDLSQIALGNCNLKRITGHSRLMVGHSQVLEVPRSMTEVSISRPSVANISSLSDRWIYINGSSVGIAVLAWFEGREDGSYAINLCPIPVFDPKEVFGADGPKSEDLCPDDQSSPVRLAVGQTITMKFDDGTRPTEIGTAAAGIASASFIDESTVSITGISRGSTSLTFMRYDIPEARNCMVVVD